MRWIILLGFCWYFILNMGVTLVLWVERARAVKDLMLGEGDRDRYHKRNLIQIE